MTEHAYTAREANKRDFPSIVDLLAPHDFGPRELAWLQWKYLQNPYGPARAFVLQNGDGKLQGLIAFLPQLYQDKQKRSFRIVQAVDGFLAPEARGKGLYSYLLNFALGKIDEPVIGFPNKNAEAIHKSNGWRVLAAEERWLFPLTLGKVMNGNHVSALSRALGFASRTYSLLQLGNSTRPIDMKPTQRFQRNFKMNSDTVCGMRSGNFLNWRFIDNPTRDYEAYDFFDRGEHIGYCVYGLSDFSVEVFDLNVTRDKKACIRAFVNHCRSKGFSHILFRGTGLDLYKLGFIRLPPHANFIGYRFPAGPYKLTFCDSDW